MGCGSLNFAHSWKLPAYSGAFLLTVDNFSFFTHSWSFFAYSYSFFTYSWSFFAYSGKVCLIRSLRDCKQRGSTVSKKTPTVSQKASPFFAAPPSLPRRSAPSSQSFPLEKQTMFSDVKHDQRNCECWSFRIVAHFSLDFSPQIRSLHLSHFPLRKATFSSQMPLGSQAWSCQFLLS